MALRLGYGSMGAREPLVLQMALTAEAARITLIALWDGKDEGDAPGGTAHMVRLARDTGQIDVKIIDAKQLLE